MATISRMGQTSCHFGVLALLFALSASLTTAKLVHRTTLSGDDDVLSQHEDWRDDRLRTFSSWGRLLQQEVTVSHVRQMDMDAQWYACRVVEPCLRRSSSQVNTACSSLMFKPSA